MKTIFSGNSTIRPYLIFGVLAFLTRAFMNFSFDLIPGVNGGYYPVQVRSILENGQLAFSDMPFYFYLNALVAQGVHTISGGSLDAVIIHTVKFFDSFLLPLTAIPLYWIDRLFGQKWNPYQRSLLVAFALLSFGPVMLTSDLQKNGAAIPFFVFAIYFLLSFIKKSSLSAAVGALAFFTLTALTHFGVFSISLLFVGIILFGFYGRKAIIPAIIGLLMAGGLVYYWDPVRALRLFSVGSMFFDHSGGFMGPIPPHSLGNILLSGLLAYGAIQWLRQAQPNRFATRLGWILVIYLLLLSFPFYKSDLVQRFSLMLFVPHTLLGMLVLPHFQKKLRIATMVTYLLLILPSFVIIGGRFKKPVLTSQEVVDLQTIHSAIPDSEHTLILARHGLEWWTAWYGTSKVGQDKAVDEETFDKYIHIYALVQTQREQDSDPHKPFPEVFAPKGRTPLVSNNTFQLVPIERSDLPAIVKHAEEFRLGPPRGRHHGKEVK